MRVLILEDSISEAAALKNVLDAKFDVQVAASLEEGIRQIGDGAIAPDVIISDLNFGDPRSTAALAALKDLAPTAPIVISTTDMRATLGEQLEPATTRERDGGLSLLRAVLRQTNIVHDTIDRHRSEILQEIDIVANRAATQAVEQAIEQLVRRLGLNDEEGMRMAIRLARGWEVAKGRFVSAIATGIASAMLIALGAGVIAMLRNQGSK